MEYWRKTVAHCFDLAPTFAGNDVPFESLTDEQKTVWANFIELVRERRTVIVHDVESKAEPQRGHSAGCASMRGSGGDDCDCGWTR